MRRIYVSCIAALLAVASATLVQPPTRAEKVSKYKSSQTPIANRYIVILKDEIAVDVTDTANALSSEYFGIIDKIYEDTVKGFSVETTTEEAMRLSADPRVKYVEEDSWVLASAVEYNPYWALDRIDQHALPYDQAYHYSGTGSGVNVYVIDTGILTTHEEIAGRAFDAVNTTSDTTPIDQCSGHGTGVAGVLGSRTFGVAKNVKLYSVRVLPCNGAGTLSDTLAGIDWVKRNAIRPAVTNVSVQSLYSQTFNDAVANSIAAGITYVVAAGNSGSDACGYSPSSVPEAIVVGGINSSDQRLSYSNYGSCVDLFAPGEAVQTIWNASNTTTTGASGTSFASPMAAGAAALYLERHRFASPAEVRNALISIATPDVVSNAGALTPNLLLYSLFPGRAACDTCHGSD